MLRSISLILVGIGWAVSTDSLQAQESKPTESRSSGSSQPIVAGVTSGMRPSPQEIQGRLAVTVTSDGTQDSERLETTVTSGFVAPPGVDFSAAFQEHQKRVKELRDLREQLLATLGPQHPALAQIERQIVLHSAKGQWLVEQTQEDMPPVHGSQKVRRPYRVESPDTIVAGERFGLAAPLEGFTWEVRPTTIEMFSAPAPAAPTRATSATAQLGHSIQGLSQRWKSNEDEAQREEIVNELKSEIGTYFDSDLNQRREQLASLEKRLEELRRQIQKRESLRDRFIDTMSHQIEMQWEGITLPTTQTLDRPAPPSRPIFETVGGNR
jgi:hypothetical protein